MTRKLGNNSGCLKDQLSSTNGVSKARNSRDPLLTQNLTPGYHSSPKANFCIAGLAEKIGLKKLTLPKSIDTSDISTKDTPNAPNAPIKPVQIFDFKPLAVPQNHFGEYSDLAPTPTKDRNSPDTMAIASLQNMPPPNYINNPNALFGKPKFTNRLGSKNSLPKFDHLTSSSSHKQIHSLSGQSARHYREEDQNTPNKTSMDAGLHPADTVGHRIGAHFFTKKEMAINHNRLGSMGTQNGNAFGNQRELVPAKDNFATFIELSGSFNPENCMMATMTNKVSCS